MDADQFRRQLGGLGDECLLGFRLRASSDGPRPGSQTSVMHTAIAASDSVTIQLLCRRVLMVFSYQFSVISFQLSLVSFAYD